MADCEIIQLVDNLAAYLKSDACTSKFPAFATDAVPPIGVNSYEEPSRPQDHTLDIHPAGAEFGDSRAGSTPEHSLTTLEFLISYKAAQYKPAVRAAFNLADDFRRVLNLNSCAKACGNVRRIWMTNVYQIEPDEDGGVFVNLKGSIRAEYAIEA